MFNLRLSCSCRAVRLMSNGAQWLAASLPLHPTTSFPGAANLPALLEYLEIRSMEPLDETLIWSVSNAVAYALEVNEGWFDRHGIQMGTRIFGIPSLSGKPERRANHPDPRGRMRARNEVRTGSFWTK